MWHTFTLLLKCEHVCYKTRFTFGINRFWGNVRRIYDPHCMFSKYKRMFRVHSLDCMLCARLWNVSMYCCHKGVMFITNVSYKSTHWLIVKNRTPPANNTKRFSLITNSLISLFSYITQVKFYKTLLPLHNPFCPSLSIIKCLYLGYLYNIPLMFLLLSLNRNLNHFTMKRFRREQKKKTSLWN